MFTPLLWGAFTGTPLLQGANTAMPFYYKVLTQACFYYKVLTQPCLYYKVLTQACLYYRVLTHVKPNCCKRQVVDAWNVLNCLARGHGKSATTHWDLAVAWETGAVCGLSSITGCLVAGLFFMLRLILSSRRLWSLSFSWRKRNHPFSHWTRKNDTCDENNTKDKYDNGCWMEIDQ